MSKRYCLTCKGVTKFLYNRNVGHSECRECGWRFREKDMELKDDGTR